MIPKIRLSRARIAYVHDVVMAGLSLLAALYLRVGDTITIYYGDVLWTAVGLFTGVAAVVFATSGMYRGVWRYASLDDMVHIARAVTLVILIFLPLMFLVTRLEALPRSVPAINWFVLMTLLGGPRILYRIFKDRRIDTVLRREGRPRVPVLLIGAGDGAELFIRSLRQGSDANYRVVGIVDEKGSRVGREIHGVPVMGSLDDWPRVYERLKRRGDRPHRAIVTKDRLDGATMRAIVNQAAELGLPVARLPRLTDFKAGGDGRIEPKPVAIEDLLGRPQTVLDRKAMSGLVAGRRVLVTGAGGTIGGELVRQISDYGPARLALLDESEFLLYEIDRELAGRHAELPRAAHLADIRDRTRLDAIMAQERPELVFHAAALKHVPMVEDHPDEGVRTNVTGSRNVADAAVAAGVRVVVQVSTDKAVNPTSVMGATKRLAEAYCQALDLEGRGKPDGTRFVTVRFGNVLGSTGSVVPLFQKQLDAGGPLTVTDPDATRYFMTTREAVELVLQASALGARDGEYGGRIFVLDMGEPVNIAELARQMIRLAGLEPDKDVAIEFIGLRPGEKLHEELLHTTETLVATPCDGILTAAPRTADRKVLARALDELDAAARAGRTEETLDALARLVPEYTPAARPPREAAAR